eukprot:8735207-Pyramimonas_sp.AAC.1
MTESCNYNPKRFTYNGAPGPGPRGRDLYHKCGCAGAWGAPEAHKTPPESTKRARRRSKRDPRRP